MAALPTGRGHSMSCAMSSREAREMAHQRKAVAPSTTSAAADRHRQHQTRSKGCPSQLVISNARRRHRRTSGALDDGRRSSPDAYLEGGMAAVALRSWSASLPARACPGSALSFAWSTPSSTSSMTATTRPSGASTATPMRAAHQQSPAAARAALGSAAFRVETAARTGEAAARHGRLLITFSRSSSCAPRLRCLLRPYAQRGTPTHEARGAVGPEFPHARESGTVSDRPTLAGSTRAQGSAPRSRRRSPSRHPPSGPRARRTSPSDPLI